MSYSRRMLVAVLAIALVPGLFVGYTWADGGGCEDALDSAYVSANDSYDTYEGQKNSAQSMRDNHTEGTDEYTSYHHVMCIYVKLMAREAKVIDTLSSMDTYSTCSSCSSDCDSVESDLATEQPIAVSDAEDAEDEYDDAVVSHGYNSSQANEAYQTYMSKLGYSQGVGAAKGTVSSAGSSCP